MQAGAKVLLQRSGTTWQQLTDYAAQIHCHNPGMFTLCGTNCYILGRGPVKTIVDPGDFPERNSEFLAHLTDYLTVHSTVKFNRILVTHGHADHFGGVHDTVTLLQQRSQATQDLQVYKLLTGNEHEEAVFERYPNLRNVVQTISDKQEFTVEPNLTVQALHTPGHLDDHTSFLIKEEKALISGDVILGAPSCAIQDLDTYLATLGKLQQMDLDWILLPHSVALGSPDLIMVEARAKIAAYIDYRVSRLNELLDSFLPHETAAQRQQENGAQAQAASATPKVSSYAQLTRQELFDRLYGPKNLTDRLKLAAYANLDLQTEKMVKDGLLRYDEEEEKFQRVANRRFML